MPSLLTHWSLSLFKRRKTCLSRLLSEYVLSAAQSCVFTLGNAGSEHEGGLCSWHMAWLQWQWTGTSSTSLVGTAGQVSTLWPWACARAPVPHCCHRLCHLWRKDETSRCQGGEHRVQPSTCGVCHTRSCQLWAFKMHPAGQLSVFGVGTF